MDAVHLPGTRSAWVSPPMHIGTTMSSFSETVLASRPRGDLRDSARIKIKNMMKIPDQTLSDELFYTIEANCNVDNLTVLGELPPMSIDVEQQTTTNTRFRALPIQLDGVEALETLRLQQTFLDKAGKQDRLKRVKMTRHLNDNGFLSGQERPEKVSIQHLDREIVAVVRVYRPVKSTNRIPTVMFNKLRYNQEIYLLGSNKLSELRDFIKCPMDVMRPGDVSKDPSKVAQGKRANEMYKGGFFYINGCFYNDTRWPECIDYSKVIREWASSKKRGIGPFRVLKMEDTLIRDLDLRLGFPYVYVHQGEHEHVFSINDVRLLSIDDPQRPSDYPQERSLGFQRAKPCMVCQINVAVWVTKDNDRAPEDPFFFCRECFCGFNYSPDGHKLGNFKAFEFIDANAM